MLRVQTLACLELHAGCLSSTQAAYHLLITLDVQSAARLSSLHGSEGRLGAACRGRRGLRLLRWRRCDGGDVLRAEHGTNATDPQQRHEERRGQCAPTKGTEGKHAAGLAALALEDNHQCVAEKGSHVAARTDDACDAADSRGKHVRDDGEATALSHVGERSPEDQVDEETAAAHVARGESREADETEAHAERLDEQSPQAAADAVPSVEEVRPVASQAPHAEVEEAKDRADGAGVLLGHAEVFGEVGHDVAVDDELDAEGEHVGEMQHPHLPIAAGLDERAHGDGARLAALLESLRIGRRGVVGVLLLALLQLAVVAVGTVIREEVHADTEQEDDRGRPRDGRAPGSVVVHAVFLARLEDLGVHDLSNAAAQVAPARGRRVGDADDAEIEHGSGPQLGQHEGSSGEADHETPDAQRLIVLRGHSEEATDRGEKKENRVGHADADAVGDRADQDAQDDGA